MTPQHDEDLRIWGSYYKYPCHRLRCCVWIYDLPGDGWKLNSAERRLKLGRSPGGDEGEHRHLKEYEALPSSRPLVHPAPRTSTISAPARGTHKKIHNAHSLAQRRYTRAGVPESMGNVPAPLHSARRTLKLKRREHRSQGGARLVQSAYATVPHDGDVASLTETQASLRHRRELFPCKKKKFKGKVNRLKLDDIIKTRGGRHYQDAQSRLTRLATPAPAPSPRPLLPHVVLGPPSLALTPLPLLLAISSVHARAYPSSAPLESEPVAVGPVTGVRTLAIGAAILPAHRTAPILEAPGGTCGAVWRYCALVEGLLSTAGARRREIWMRTRPTDQREGPVAALELPHFAVAAGGAVVEPQQHPPSDTRRGVRPRCRGTADTRPRLSRSSPRQARTSAADRRDS
ncbi:hypothetical protein B0H13DRAFT_2290197 [Mycena leptocephala]|nr:hypothetical protein B0H13DRAFT_2290197 [Mycena leptocephala]